MAEANPLIKTSYRAGMAPSDIHNNSERLKASTSNVHPFFSWHHIRLKSKNKIQNIRKSWRNSRKCQSIVFIESKKYPNLKMELKEGLAPSHRENWVTWKSLHRLQTRFDRTKMNFSLHWKQSFVSFKILKICQCTSWPSMCTLY